MDIWLNRLSDAEADVRLNQDNLNLYATSANSATSQATWDKFKGLYDSEKSIYDNNLEVYNSAYEDASRYANNRRVVSTMYDIPNAKDRDEWLAGGYFRNQSFAGGVMWSATTMGAYKLVSHSDKTSKLLQGALLDYMNYGFGSIMNTIMGGSTLDLMFDADKRMTSSYEVNISYLTQNGQSVSVKRVMTISNNGDGSNSFGFDSGKYNGASMSLSETQRALSHQNSMIESLASSYMSGIAGNPLAGTLALSIYDMATGKTARAQDRIASATIGMVTSKISEVVTSKAISALGITNIGLAIGVSVGVNMIVGELAEMALGLDNSFGFGGDLVGVDINGKQYNVKSMGVFEGIKDMAYSAFDSSYMSMQEQAYASFEYNQYQLELGYMEATGFNNDQMDSIDWDGMDRAIESELDAHIAEQQYGVDVLGQIEALGFSAGSVEANNYSADLQAFNNNVMSTGYESGGVEGAHSARMAERKSNGQSTSVGGDGDRWCCTVMVNKGLWTNKQKREFAVWDSKQSKVWRVGYQIWGKILADNQRYIPLFNECMDAMYEHKIMNKKTNNLIYLTYLYTYPMVYITGAYSVIKNKAIDLFHKIYYNS